MKKKLTRLFSVLLAAVLVLGTLPVSAEGEGGTSKDVSVVVGGTEIVTLENKTIDEDDIGEVKDNTIAKVGVTSEKVTVPTYEQVKDKTYATNTEYYVSTASDATEPVGPIQFVTSSSNETRVKYNNAYITLKQGSYGTDSESGSNVTITPQNDGTFQIYRTGKGGSYYLNVSNSAFGCSNDNPVSLYLYTKNENPGTRTDTTITFTGVAEGSTSVTIGGVTYNITVTKENLENVTPLTIEYWITNAQLAGTKKTTANSISIPATTDGITSDAGVDVADLVDAYATDSDSKRERVYWQSRLLDTSKTVDTGEGVEYQTTSSKVDNTQKGVAFTKVRYNSGTWQVWTENGTWKAVDQTEQNVSYNIWNNNNKSWDSKSTTRQKHQLVAYYMEKVDITNDAGNSELEIYASDWGVRGSTEEVTYSPGNTDGFVTLSFQVVSTSGYENPSGTTAAVLATKSLIYNKWDARGVGTLNFSSDEYEIIKITAETGDVTCSPTSGSKTKITNFTWKTDEATVWGEDDNENPQFFVSIANTATNPTVTTGEAIRNLAWKNASSDTDTNTAILIRIYVKPKSTADKLDIYYMDCTGTGTDYENASQFYSSGIVVNEGTTYNENFAFVAATDTEKASLKNNSVKNSTGEDEYVKYKLEQLPELKSRYKVDSYEFVYAKRSTDGKSVYLYYTFENVANYLIDFGTPLVIQASDVWTGVDSENVTVNSVTVKNDNPYGETKVSEDKKTITYTPKKAFASSSTGDTFIVTCKYTEGNDNEAITFNIHILPASNVLYEENFLTVDATPEKAETLEWDTTSRTATITDPQQTQKTDGTDTYSVFGYDDTYNTAATENGVYTIGTEDNPLKPNKLYTPLTTTFYGNTFDLIGNCGTDTGRIMLVFKNADGKYERVVDILDTRYTKGTIYQVPLAHVTLGEGKDAEHTVLIYASGLEEETITNATMNAASPASLTDEDVEEDEFLAAVLEENGINISDVDYVQTTVMDELESLDASETSASLYSTMLTTDDGDSDTETNSSGKDAGTHVDIAGFRVYRTTTTSVNVNDESKTVAEYYPKKEQNIEYINILEAVGETVTAVVDTETGVVTNYNVEKYEDAGGPQNEIYLKNGQSVTIQLKNKDGDVLSKPIQVSLRAVSSETSWSMSTDSTGKVIKSNTEMYYTITPDKDGVVTITNKGKGLLALGNVKFPASTTVVTASNMPKETVLASLRAAYGVEEPETFTPDTFTVKTTSTKLVTRKVITLKINVSSDVAYVTVNGKKYTRTGLQSASKNTRTIRVIDSASKSAEKTYEIIAYNSDGVASEVITKTVK